MIDINCYADGGFSIENKTAFYSYKIYDQKSNKLIKETIRNCAFASTNNEAEYSAMKMLLTFLVINVNSYNSINIFCDSKLIVNQLNGSWRVLSENLLNLHNLCSMLLGELNNVSLIWVNRKIIFEILGH